MLDYDNVKSSIGGLTKGSKFTTDAFDDVSQGNTRNKVIIDNNNFDSDFKDAYYNSGFTNVEEFLDAARKSGIDVVLNESSLEKTKSADFRKGLEQQRMKRKQPAR